jgi:poly-gamma-glutamate capsule biosynthesis protein CapA/YwtB (metallophosphatase superfamily)
MKFLLRGALVSALLMLTACSRPATDFTLTLGGDIMLARDGLPLFTHQTTDINPWVELQKQGVLIGNDSSIPDYFFANLESPLGKGKPDSDEMNLCSDPSQVKVLIEGGVDLVSLANNHRDDCSSDGAEITRITLNEQNIRSAIMGEEPVTLDIPGGKMAVIAAEDVTGTLDVQSLLNRIMDARKQAQVVVVAMHWGSEYQAGADDRQKKLAQQIADAGADVIWGHHPHVLQKMEWLTSKDGRQVLVINSLGNLLADQWMLEDAQRSALVRLSFTDFKITAIEIIPIKMVRASRALQLMGVTQFNEDVFARLAGGQLFSDKVKVQLFSDTQ